MRYRRLPYAVRYFVALAAWLAIISLDILVRIMFLPVMPFFMAWSGFAQTQHGAQLSVNLVDFYTRPLMRMPRTDWRRLLGRGGHSADRDAKPGFVKRIPGGGI